MTRRARLRDVAAEAGVSLGTVSNVLNDAERVRPATRERVYEAVRRLGYVGPLVTMPATRAHPVPPKADAPLLVSAGYVSVDTVGLVDVMPHRNDRVTARRVSKHLGGPAAGVAVAAAALGPPFHVDAELATAIGDDHDSLWAANLLAERGVRVRAVRRAEAGRLSRCIVIVEPSGHRTRINEHLVIDGSELIPHLSTRPARRRRHLHLEGYQVGSMLSFVSPELRAAGWTVSAHDTGLSAEYMSEAGFAGLVRSLDRMILNRRTAARILGLGDISTGALVEQLARRHRGLDTACEIVVTLGVEGAVILAASAGEPVRVPALPVRVVDGTGAGDTFTGAYIVQRLHDVTPDEAARRACIAASLTMTAEGAQGRRTTAREIDEVFHAETS